MTYSKLVRTFYVVGTLALLCFPSAGFGQVRPSLDPDIPSYIAPDQVSGKLTISPAESLKPLVRGWVDEVVRRHPKLNITLTKDGSDTGLAALLEHRAHIAAMSRRLTADEIAEFVQEYGFEPTEVPVAADALAIYVHKDNPVTGLALDELDAMFCRERRRGIKYVVDSWGLVGVMDEWFDTPIQLYGRNGKSGSSYFFRDEVCRGGALHTHLADAQGLASVVLDVGTDPNGIGFSAIGYRTELVKPVPIALVKDGRYVEPSIQAAMDGSYPLRRNLYFYLAKPPKTETNPITAELIRYALSRQGQQQAIDFGYLPLTSTENKRLLAKWPVAIKAARLEPLTRPGVQ